MKKIGIVTITGKINFGNRLQNYALQEVLKKICDCNVETIINYAPSNNKKISLVNIMKLCKLATIDYFKENNMKRRELFEIFDRKIKFSEKKFLFNFNSYNFDYLIVGSDQVWNPQYRMSDFDLCNFNNGNAIKISYASSLGVDKLPNNFNKQFVTAELNKFKAISVREEKGKELLLSLINKKIDVLIDPTLLLESSEWLKIAKKPSRLKCKKYILDYFLGTLPLEIKNKIYKVAEENECEVINILDKKDELYETGPSEFLYLVNNAFLVCTDSFHSAVFSFIFNKSFILFERNQKNISNMNNRLETFINKFNLKDRKYNGKSITQENLEHDYTEAYKILEEERKKSDRFLRNALDIKDGD